MNYIKRLFSNRIGSLAYLVGILIFAGGWWLIYESGIVNSSTAFGNYAQMTVMFALIVFMMAVIVRRLHDLNKSGWLSLLAFVPLAGSILGVILLFKPGNRGTNQYGAPSRGGKHIISELFVLEHLEKR